MSVQSRVRPYLDQPYQLALKLMDCCDGSEYRSIEDIALTAKVSKTTARQVLNVLREGGLVIFTNTAGGWQPLEVDRVEIRRVSPPAEPSDSSMYYQVEEQQA
ncbi:hypothetical protein H6F89_33230 [Cyanobacteria bacterium FACHB-63]|nr:hypothetical protein [Cyanobacteria bacterium FACHB-63]